MLANHCLKMKFKICSGPYWCDIHKEQHDFELGCDIWSLWRIAQIGAVCPFKNHKISNAH